MILSELRVENLRNISELVINPQSGINLFTGANGAGKTSILEGIYLLSHAGSFRTRRGEILVQRNRERLSIFGEIRLASGSTARLGLIQESGRWIAKVDGRTPASLSALLERCAVVCFEPGSHALISGASEERRRFLDWGVFHVEPAFVDVARRYRRALRQRNPSGMGSWQPQPRLSALPEPATWIGSSPFLESCSRAICLNSVVRRFAFPPAGKPTRIWYWS